MPTPDPTAPPLARIKIEELPPHPRPLLCLFSGPVPMVD